MIQPKLLLSFCNIRHRCVQLLALVPLLLITPSLSFSDSILTVTESVKVTLTDSNGRSYNGTGRMNETFSHGTVEIAATPYGKLEGRFAFMPTTSATPDEHHRYINLYESIRLTERIDPPGTTWKSMGRLYFFSGGSLVIRCDIGMNNRFREHVANMGFEIHAAGVCADRKGNRFKLDIVD